MRVDVSRVTFEPVKHYSSVRVQQGRVSVDADWNEQVDITEHRQQTEAADVIGRTGAPRDNAGFLLVPIPPTGPAQDIAIAPGRMYVDGILCELESGLAPNVKLSGKSIQVGNTVVDGNEFQAGQWVQVSATDNTAPSPLQTQITAVAGQTLTVGNDLSGFVGKTGLRLQRIATYSTQPDYPLAPALPASNVALMYLDVWERTITALDDPELRDPALGPANGADTTARTKTVWQVKYLQSSLITSASTCATVPDLSALLPQSTGMLWARSEPTGAPSACILPPRAGYRRLENQLYRIEVHTAGDLVHNKPTFKWSRENGSVVAAIVSPAPVLSAGTSLTMNVNTLGRDQVLGFAAGQWVEITDDGRELAGLPGFLVQLTGAAQGPQGPVLTADATLASTADLKNYLSGFNTSAVRNPKVRRWDQSGSQVSTNSPGGDILIEEGTPIDLESGVQITFAPGGNYVTGDYWLVPARTLTGNVDWPHDSAGTPQFRPPQGIRHHYCRLGIVNFNTSTWVLQEDCRQLFAPAADGGIQIQSVSCTSTNGAVLNDANVALQDVANGISIQCDTPIDPLALVSNLSSSGLSKPVCSVTIEVPNVAAAGQAPFAGQPMVVAANLGLDATGTIIQWTPTAPAQTWINGTLSSLLTSNAAIGRMLARLNMKGSFIWAKGNTSVFLDGQAFGAAVAPDQGNQRTGIALPSGNGRAGSDFNMWFWLISKPSLVTTPGIVNFGNQIVKVASAVVSVILTNNTSAPITIKSITLDNTADFSQTSSCLAAALPANGGTCNISVTFTPSAPGFRTGTITITPATGDPLTVQLSGTGVAGTLQASPSPLGLKAVLGSLGSGTVTLSNGGGANVTITQVSQPAATQFHVVSPTLPTTVASGGSINVAVNFTPSATGTITSSFQITHNGIGSPLTVSLQGTGSSAGGGTKLQGIGSLGPGRLQIEKIG